MGFTVGCVYVFSVGLCRFCLTDMYVPLDFSEMMTFFFFFYLEETLSTYIAHMYVSEVAFKKWVRSFPSCLDCLWEIPCNV